MLVVFLVRIFMHSNWIRRDATRIRKNTDQKNSEYGHFSNSVFPKKTITFKWLGLGKQNIPVRVRLLAICRGKKFQKSPGYCLNACKAGGSGNEELKKCPPFPLQSCDSWMFVKEDPERKKEYIENVSYRIVLTLRLKQDYKEHIWIF